MKTVGNKLKLRKVVGKEGRWWWVEHIFGHTQEKCIFVFQKQSPCRTQMGYRIKDTCGEIGYRWDVDKKRLNW